MSIGYEKVEVTEEHLNRYQQEKEKAEGMAKYVKFKGWLHYANLRRWQRQGHHVIVLSGQPSGLRRIHCACGMYVEPSELLAFQRISLEVEQRCTELALDEIQVVKGHLNMDDFESLTQALLVDFIWDKKLGDYLWKAYCQSCGDLVTGLSNQEAKKFVTAHNAKCSSGYGRD